MKKYEIWIEGHRASGDYSHAQKITETYAENFQSACDKICKDPKIQNRFGTYDSSSLTLWGCKLYPTEEKARKHFG